MATVEADALSGDATVRDDEQEIDEVSTALAAAALDGPRAVKEAARHELARELHRHPAEISNEPRTLGQKAADIVTSRSGWWPMIVAYLTFTAAYLIVNHYVTAFDSTLQYYTFAVSVLAIFLAQVILLSQNRQADIETKLSHNSYEQVADIDDLQHKQMQQLELIHKLISEVHALTQAVDRQEERTRTEADQSRRR